MGVHWLEVRESKHFNFFPVSNLHGYVLFKLIFDSSLSRKFENYENNYNIVYLSSISAVCYKELTEYMLSTKCPLIYNNYKSTFIHDNVKTKFIHGM